MKKRPYNINIAVTADVFASLQAPGAVAVKASRKMLQLIYQAPPKPGNKARRLDDQTAARIADDPALASSSPAERGLTTRSDTLILHRGFSHNTRSFRLSDTQFSRDSDGQTTILLHYTEL